MQNSLQLSGRQPNSKRPNSAASSRPPNRSNMPVAVSNRSTTNPDGTSDVPMTMEMAYHETGEIITPDSKKRRLAISDAQRLQLRKKRRESGWNQKQLCDWFVSTYGRRITQGQVSDILSSKYERLDGVDENAPDVDLENSFRTIDAAYPELESMLYEWHQREAAAGVHVTGEMLKARAIELWDIMPEYYQQNQKSNSSTQPIAADDRDPQQPQPRPAFSNGWLEGYKRRKNIASQRATTRSLAPKPAYLPQPGSPLLVDRERYLRIARAPKTVAQTIDIPPRSARAWRAPAGSIVRISTPSGPQVGDLNLWSSSNPRERFWAARTRQLHSSHVSTFDRLWSCLPFLRPLATIVDDSLARFGVDEHGGRVHDLLGTRCDPYVNALLSGTSYDFHCHSNLVRAVLPFGLQEADVHDVLNVFQVTGLTKDAGKYWMGASPAKAGDYVDLFAETDLLGALSACPGGDLSVWGFDGEAGERMRESCRPLRVEVFQIDEPWREEVLGSWWKEPKPAFELYTGMHGIKIPGGEDDAGATAAEE